MSDTQPSVPTSDTPLSQRVAERRKETQEKPAPQSDDGDLHHELHDEFQRQHDERANGWRYG